MEDITCISRALVVRLSYYGALEMQGRSLAPLVRIMHKSAAVPAGPTRLYHGDADVNLSRNFGCALPEIAIWHLEAPRFERQRVASAGKRYVGNSRAS